MAITRRQVTQMASKLGLLGLSGINALPVLGAVTKPATQPLKILILGGTGFVGPHIVRHVIDRGHTPTLFNRGKSDPHLFPDLEKLVGNRGGPLDVLKGRTWDVVIDTSSFVPPQVYKSAKLLQSSAEHYIYISSTAVYKDWSQASINEDSPVIRLPKKGEKKLDPFDRYGASKFESEKRVELVFPKNHTVIRPDSIVGPGDAKHFRYGYWTRRATQGGEVLGPGTPGDPVQYLDARDLAEWIVHCAEQRVQGTFSASSHPASYSMKNMIDDCLMAAESSAPTIWVSDEFLREQMPIDFPYWTPYRSLRPATGHLDISRALKNGLKQRPKIDTAKDVLAWYKQNITLLKDHTAGVPLAREGEILAAWREKNPT